MLSNSSRIAETNAETAAPESLGKMVRPAILLIPVPLGSIYINNVWIADRSVTFLHPSVVDNDAGIELPILGFGLREKLDSHL